MSGFEVIGVLSFVLSAPGIAVAIAQCGQYLKEKIQKLRDAPKIINNFLVFAEDLHNGKLKAHWELAEWVFQKEDMDQSLKDDFENSLRDFKILILAIDALLDKIFDKNGVKRRLFITFSSEMKKLQDDVARWKSDFQQAIAIADIKTRVLPSPTHLTSEKFVPIGVQTDSSYGTRLEGTTHVWLATGEFKGSDGSVSEVRVLVERRSPDTFPDPDDIKHAAAYLMSRMSSKVSQTGILECIGYRADHYGRAQELLFRIPDGLAEPLTLEALLNRDAQYGYGGGRTLNDRLRIAKQLAEAVLSVHIAGLVHKNIRPNTILLFTRDATGHASSSDPSIDVKELYLTNWSLLRGINDLSRRVSKGSWAVGFYQHPERQGLLRERRYNLGHDIYSLGVTLLEIGLWESLVIEAPEEIPPLELPPTTLDPNYVTASFEPRLSETYRRTAVQAAVVTELESFETENLISPPQKVQQVLTALARKELPPRVGTAYADLVVSCLTCMEGGLGNPSVFTDTRTDVALKYKDAVLAPLSSIIF
jgi:hypothetical protein